jgi:antitoxin CptB
MPGLDPGIYVLSAAANVDGRVKPGHDDETQLLTIFPSHPRDKRENDAEVGSPASISPLTSPASAAIPASNRGARQALRGDTHFAPWSDRMTGTTVSSADIEPRRRRILFRAWHRGTREMDLLMGQFTDSEIRTMSEDDLEVLEALCEAPDRDIFAWMTGKEETPSNYNTELFRRLKAFHTHSSPVNI